MKAGDVITFKVGDKVNAGGNQNALFLCEGHAILDHQWVIKDVFETKSHIANSMESMEATWAEAVCMDFPNRKTIRFLAFHSHFSESHIVKPTVVGRATLRWVMDTDNG